MRFEKKRNIKTLIDVFIYYHLDSIVKDIDKVNEVKIYPYHSYKEYSYIYFNAKGVDDLYAACKYIKEFMTITHPPIEDAPKGIPIYHLKHFTELVNYYNVSVSPKRRIKGKDPYIVIKFKGSFKTPEGNAVMKLADYERLTCLDEGLSFNYSSNYLDISRSFSDIPSDELKTLLPLFKDFMHRKTNTLKASPEWWARFIHAMNFVRMCCENPIVSFNSKHNQIRISILRRY